MNANPMTERDLNGKWIDFYALLGVEPDTDKETLRKKIGQTYADASANCDHRDLQRRHYFQTMVERVLPQCRRVLLDPDMRAAYDEENARHRAGDPGALDYVSFMTALLSGGARPSGEFDALPEKLQDEINLARSIIECVESGSELDFLPATSVTSQSSVEEIPVTPPVRPAPTPAPAKAPTPPPDTTYFAQAPVQNPASPRADSATPTPAPTGEPETAAVKPTARRPAPAEPRAQVIINDGPTIKERYEAAAAKAIADDGSLSGSVKLKDRTESTPYKSRVVIGEDEDKGRGWGEKREGKAEGKRVLSPLTTHLATAVVSALLIATILNFSADAPPPVAAAGRVPLTIAFASELRPVLESAEKQFEESEEGQNVDVVLQSVESRDGMIRLLAGSGGNRPDVWIPSESLWSNQYNRVASQRRQRSISQARPLALSPLVLVARSDRAAILRDKFPNRSISSWNALRTLVPRQCRRHFGIANPQSAGSGAIARYFMAREWAETNRRPWNSDTLRNPALWQWMRTFEDNVPEYRTTGDMVRDMALGTTDLYWWSLAYESDAIYWIGQGKNLEIFYLPGTYYADHPFCHIEGGNRKNNAVRAQFERLLRSQPVQVAMLQSGFRAPEIDLKTDVPGNPFNDKGYAARGVQRGGVEVGGRLDYRTINALTAQWGQRFSS